MSVSTNMILWRMGGLINGVQTWSIGLWSNVGTPTATPTQTDLDSALTAVLSLFSTFWTTLKSRNSAGISYTNLSAYWYPGGSSTAVLVSKTSFTAVVGTGSGPHPAYTSCCATLLTDAAGRSRRGRAYLPATAMAVNTSHQFASTDVDALANALAALTSGLNLVSIGGPWGNAPVWVRSEKLGVAHTVQRIRIDNNPDTQRRREDKIVPSYFKTVVAL